MTKIRIDYYENANGYTYCEDCKESLSLQEIEDTVHSSDLFEQGKEPICDGCQSTITE